MNKMKPVAPVQERSGKTRQEEFVGGTEAIFPAGRRVGDVLVLLLEKLIGVKHLGRHIGRDVLVFFHQIQRACPVGRRHVS